MKNQSWPPTTVRIVATDHGPNCGHRPWSESWSNSQIRTSHQHFLWTQLQLFLFSSNERRGPFGFSIKSCVSHSDWLWHHLFSVLLTLFAFFSALVLFIASLHSSFSFSWCLFPCCLWWSERENQAISVVPASCCRFVRPRRRALFTCHVARLYMHKRWMSDRIPQYKCTGNMFQSRKSSASCHWRQCLSRLLLQRACKQYKSRKGWCSIESWHSTFWTRWTT